MSKRVTTEQLHEEIVGMRELLEAIFDNLAVDENTKVEKTEEPETISCQVHGVTMYRREGPYGTFYNHGKEVSPGRWVNCQGSGFKMKKVEG